MVRGRESATRRPPSRQGCRPLTRSGAILQTKPEAGLFLPPFASCAHDPVCGGIASVDLCYSCATGPRMRPMSSISRSEYAVVPGLMCWFRPALGACWYRLIMRLAMRLTMRWLPLTVCCLLGACSVVLRDVPRPVTHALEDPLETSLGRSTAARLAQAGANAGQSGFHLIASGQDAFLVRAGLARAAERTLDLQYYIVAQDATATFWGAVLNYTAAGSSVAQGSARTDLSGVISSTG